MTTQDWIDYAVQNGLNYILIFAKISAIMGGLLFLRRDFVPTRVLLGLSLILSFFVLYSNLYIPYTKHDHWTQWLYGLVLHLGLGFFIGYIINLFAEIFLAVGQFISVQSGLGFVNFYVPKVGQITPMSQFFLILSTIIFFHMNAHVLLIKMIVESFTVPKSLNPYIIPEIIQYTKIIFSSTLMLSVSIIVTILLSNLTIAFMTKFSPQINIFSIGINVSLIISFLCLYLVIDSITNNGNVLLNEILTFCRELINAGKL